MRLISRRYRVFVVDAGSCMRELFIVQPLKDQAEDCQRIAWSAYPQFLDFQPLAMLTELEKNEIVDEFSDDADVAVVEHTLILSLLNHIGYVYRDEEYDFVKKGLVADCLP